MLALKEGTRKPIFAQTKTCKQLKCQIHQPVNKCFALNKELPRTTHNKYPANIRKYLLKSLVPVTWPLSDPFVSDPFVLFDRLLQKKQH